MALIVLTILILVGSVVSGEEQSSQKGALEWCIFGYNITLCGSRRVAGAIDFLTYGDTQYINAYDHGRELQIAITNKSNECYNPTEAGSENDGTWKYSSSRLLSVNTTGNIYTSSSYPAFWLAPNEIDPGSGCKAVNKMIVSKYRIDKTIQLAPHNVTNAILYKFAVVVPEAQSLLRVESPTGYMPILFDTFYTINLKTGQLTQVSTGPAGTPDPVIISSSDGQHAMASYLASAPASSNLSYVRYFFPSSDHKWATSKWSNLWWTSTGVSAGQILRFESIICVGPLTSVQSCMAKLANTTGYVHQ